MELLSRGKTMRLIVGLIALGLVFTKPNVAEALDENVIKSVVSVLPIWAGRPQGGTGARPGTAPEGTGIVISDDGLIVTAWHVIEPARRVDIRLSDGRIFAASPVSFDEKTDIALLRIDAEVPPIKRASRTTLGEPVCAISNAYGLDLSISCGVISQKSVSNAGFNDIEDFIQTDAAANPGSSGGALVNRDGELVGMVSAIFASGADNNIGINFAVSNALLDRVIDDLLDDDNIDYFSPGWELEPLTGTIRSRTTGARISSLVSNGAAEKAGFEVGDIINQIGSRFTRDIRDVETAIALMKLGSTDSVRVLRGESIRVIPLTFDKVTKKARPTDPDCPHPSTVCALRQAVFPVSAYDPAASSIRIADNLLVTNRHVIGDWKTANVITPAGVLEGKVIPSSFEGDLALIEVEGLPENGQLFDIQDLQNSAGEGPFYTIGADVDRREIRVFEPGNQLVSLADAPFARLHVSAFMKPGVSGGALVNQAGQLAGVAVGGGEGRFEAIPVSQVSRLLDGRNDANATNRHNDLSNAYVQCNNAIDEAGNTPRGQSHTPEILEALERTCIASGNVGSLLEAGRIAAQGRAFSTAVNLHQKAVDRVPHSLNSRLTLASSLQFSGRFDEMLPHVEWLLDHLPQDRLVLRYAIQSGVWGGDKDLAERGFQGLLAVDQSQAEAARRFIDRSPPAPPRR